MLGPSMARHLRIANHDLPVDRTLRRFVVLFRVLAWVWMALLVAAVPGSDSGANLAITGAAMALATVGTVATAWAAARRPRVLASAWFVVADLVAALLVASASTMAGAENLFHGGYPMSTIFVTAYAFDMQVALVTASVLVIHQMGVHIIDERGLVPLLGSVVFFVMAIMVGWVFDNLRAQDRARLEVEDKLDKARADRIRHTERIELANRLHDSVVQTLIALRRDADDPDRIRYLARRQERQMRQTISEFRSPFARSVRVVLQGICDDIEDVHRVEIDAVFRGDADLSTEGDAVLRLAREALVNAAKHSGADTIDLYGEFDATRIHLFVRDRGSGFDPAIVGDGHGQDLPQRAAAVGATATVSSEPGAGTEVEILWEEQ
jgi:signal transduction histidine kinase